MFSHIFVGADDVDASKKFYDAVLGAIGVPEAGIALIFPVDRVLDMMRTVANITSDATVSMLVAKSAGKLGEPHPVEWDDDYKKGE